MNHDIPAILETLYERALHSKTTLTPEQEAHALTIVANAERQRGVLAATLTSLIKKYVMPEQDVRLHKDEFAGGYSGRVFDTAYVTPFIRRHFPRLAMKSGSGWLTRSIEQAHPFDLNFPGRISNQTVKAAFLNIIHDVETNGASPEQYLFVILRALQVVTATSIVSSYAMLDVTIVRVYDVVNALQDHFGLQASSRLPVIALHTVYALLLASHERYAKCQLLPLKSHTTSDIKSGTIGDIEVVDQAGEFFEAVEVKHRIKITPTMIEDAYEKVQNTSIRRYYLLTTAEPNTVSDDAIQQLLDEYHRDQNLEFIVNGIIPSLKYYLRLLPNPAEFVVRYTSNLQLEFESGTDIRSEHLERWHAISTRLLQ
jgi:DNA (cytosine-5)-methyltransferase 1